MKKPSLVYCLLPVLLAIGHVAVAADLDGDMIDDAWEATYGLSSSDINDALDDTDGDGQIARDEYHADTHPGQASSQMEITAVSVDAAGIVTITWSTDTEGQVSPAPTYNLLSLDQELVPGNTWTALQTGMATAGTTHSTTDDISGLSAILRLYRPVITGHRHSGTSNLGAAARYSLPEGKSYIGIPLEPASATLLSLLGLDQLPGGDSLANATTVDIWDQNTQSLTDRYWLSNVGGSEGWFESDAVTPADNVVVDLSKGIIITIRAGEGTQDLYVAGTVPSIADSQTLKGSGFTLASLYYPMSLPVDESGLVDSGFNGHSGFSLLSDWVMLFDSSTGLFDTKLWYDTTTPAWRYVDSLEEANEVSLEPGTPFLVRRFAASDMIWTNAYPGTPTITIEAADAVAAEQEGKPGRIRINRAGSLLPLTIDFTISGNTNPLLPSAQSSEYTLRDGTFSNLVSGRIHIPFGEAYAELLVEPTADATDEPAEAITFDVDTPGGYQVGSQTRAVVKIGDKDNVESNQVVYIAYLRPQNGVDSTAFGLATIRLRGDNDIGVLNLSFSGLTSPQSDVHIHRVDNNAIVEDVPLGQVSNYHWEMEPFGGYSNELAVVQALKNGGLYLNVHSDDYPGGEITGVFNESIGSTELQIPDPPPAFTNLTADLLEMDIARFLNQATFGATTAQIAEVQSYIDTYGGGTNRIAGMSKWLDDQLDTNVVEQTFAAEHTWAAYYLNGGFSNSGSYGADDYYAIMNVQYYGQDQVRQRIATALSEIFVISTQNGGIFYAANRATAGYYDMLADHAHKDYTDLLYNVSVHPLMGRYLSHIRNGKEVTNAMGEVISSPDENYAREIMQLFSLGLVKLHLDGSVHIGANGLPLETYTQDTIFEVAKVFTGWGFSQREDGLQNGGVIPNSNFFLGNGGREHLERWHAPMKMFQSYHDETEKVTLDGATIPAGQSGEDDLADFVDILGAHPNIAPTISRKLIQRLVTSSPSAGYLYRVANTWTNTNGNIKEVVKAILLDHEARSMENDSHVTFGKMKEPIVSYVSMLRTFNGTANITLDLMTPSGFDAAEMAKYPAGAGWIRLDPTIGQRVMNSPTVFNFFLPEYSPPGSLSIAGVTAPEFQLLTPSQLYDHINEMYYCIYTTRGGKSFFEMTTTHGFTGEDDDLILDFQEYVDLYDAEASDALGSEAVIDRLDLLMNGGRMKRLYDGAASPNPRSILIDLGTNMSDTTENRVKTMVYVFINSPDFAIQR